MYKITLHLIWSDTWRGTSVWHYVELIWKCQIAIIYYICYIIYIRTISVVNFEGLNFHALQSYRWFRVFIFSWNSLISLTQCIYNLLIRIKTQETHKKWNPMKSNTSMVCRCLSRQLYICTLCAIQSIYHTYRVECICTLTCGTSLLFTEAIGWMISPSGTLMLFNKSCEQGTVYMVDLMYRGLQHPK